MKSAGVSGRIEALAALQARMIGPLIREAGMTLPTFLLLSALAARGGGCRQAELVDELGLAPATLSESIRLHVERGLITHLPDPSDRRSKRVALTEAGKGALAKIAPGLKKLDRLYDEVLGIEDSRHLARLLDRAFDRIVGLGQER